MRNETPPESFLRAVRAHQGGRAVDAEAAYRETLATHPFSQAPYANLVTLMHRHRRWDDAEQVMREAIANGVDVPHFRFQLGFSRLSAGDYGAGFELFEERKRAPRSGVRTPCFSFPEWRGEPVHRLLLLREGGLGDQIMFARYAPLLRERGVHVSLACQASLARLCEPLGVDFIPADGAVSFGRHDAWALLGSLPLRFATRVDSVPPPIPVRPSPRHIGGLGVVTSGNANFANDANRSMSPDVAQRLLALPGAVSLAPEHTGARDFQETADIIAGLDLVVTVDTAVAHLAGSMGKPVWVLLPYIDPDWRWLREGPSTPWYPTARLFRQPTPGDWASVIAEVKAALG